MFFVDMIKSRQIFRAAKTGDTKTLCALLNEGIDVNIKDKNGMTPLMWAAYSCNLNAAEFLLDYGAEINTKNNFGETALKMVELGLYPEVAELLKENGAMV